MSRDEVMVSPGDRVGVVGCGNTAMDAARTALRMGASEVSIIYHNTIDRMSALRAEYDDAVKEGVKFLWESSVTNITGGDDGKLRSVTITRGDESREMPLERLIMAVGSAPASRIVSTTEGIDVDSRGYVLTRETPYGMTTRRVCLPAAMSPTAPPPWSTPCTMPSSWPRG